MLLIVSCTLLTFEGGRCWDDRSPIRFGSTLPSVHTPASSSRLIEQPLLKPATPPLFSCGMGLAKIASPEKQQILKLTVSALCLEENMMSSEIPKRRRLKQKEDALLANRPWDLRWARSMEPSTTKAPRHRDGSNYRGVDQRL